jgi:hypothetical protein
MTTFRVLLRDLTPLSSLFGSETENYHGDMAEVFPRAIQVDVIDRNLSELIEIIDNPKSYHHMKIKTAKTKAEGAATVQKGKQPIEPIYIGFPECFSKRNCFTDRSAPDDIFQKVLRKLLKWKVAGDNHFRILKLMDDSTLKTLTYQYHTESFPVSARENLRAL